MALIKKYDKYGNHIDYEFKPTPLMWHVVMSSTKPKYENLSEAKLLANLGLGDHLMANWKKRHNIKNPEHPMYTKKIGCRMYFNEWWEAATEPR